MGPYRPDIGRDCDGLPYLFVGTAPGLCLGFALHLLPAEGTGTDELRERLAKVLASLLSEAELEPILAVIDVASGAAPPANAGQLIDDHLGAFLDATEARKKLASPADAAYLGDRRARILYALGVLVGHLRDSAKQSAVIEKLSSALGLDAAVTAPLLRVYLKHPDATGAPVIEIFAHDDVRDFDAASDAGDPVVPRPADLPAPFAAYKRLHKAAMVLGRFHVSRQELSRVLGQGPSLGTLDLQSLPVSAAVAAAAVPYGPWAPLRDAVALRDRLVPKRLFDLFEAAAAAETDGTAPVLATAHEALLTSLEQRTRWSKDDLELLVGAPARDGAPAVPGALGLAYPSDWKDERALARLDEVMAVVRRVGLPVKTLWSWRSVPRAGDFAPADVLQALAAQRAQAGAIKQAVRARYGVSRWRDGGPTSAPVPGFGGISEAVQSVTNSPAHSVDDSRTDFFDVNSDGLPDIIVTDPARYRTPEGGLAGRPLRAVDRARRELRPASGAAGQL